MTKLERTSATLSLTKLIDVWINANCDDYDVGYWYDGQASDMAEAAVLVLAASANAQEFVEDA